MSEVCTAFGSGAMPLNTIVDIMFPLSSLPVEGKKNRKSGKFHNFALWEIEL